VISTLIPTLARVGQAVPEVGAPDRRSGCEWAQWVGRGRRYRFQICSCDLDFEGTPPPGLAVRYKGNGTYMESRNSIRSPLRSI